MKADYKHSITIGWQLVKNPQIQSKMVLEQHISKLNPNHSQTQEVKSAFKQLASSEKSRDFELER